MTKKRIIAVVTVGRSDFGLYETIFRQIKATPSVDLRLMPTGAHFAPRFGTTITEIEAQGFNYERGLEAFLDTNTPQGTAKSLGLGIISFAQAFAFSLPDMLLVLGDRIEMLSAPLAAMSYNIPVAHIHGGKVTEGAIDELVRHALTKMSHLHFVSCDEYAHRILQMGEEPWRVFNVGALGLDRIRLYKRSSRIDLYAQVGLDSDKPFLLVTYHPVTLETQYIPDQIESLLKALEQVECQIVLTYPNADVGNSIIIDHFKRFYQANSNCTRFLENAGSKLYIDLMTWASAMIGNSSSGIVEAPSFELPVVNIGTRQAGAMRAANVIDVGYTVDEITRGIRTALSVEFRQSLQGIENPYGDGHAGEKIIEVLCSIPIDDHLIRKKFVDTRR